jgi:hypothetical protein
MPDRARRKKQAAPRPLDPEELKQKILEDAGFKVPDIPIEDALDPKKQMPSAAPVPDLPEDADPSREIPSAELPMTFDGSSNGGSANLDPYIEKRLGEIKKRMEGPRPRASKPRARPSKSRRR